ncbi:hypothetical protein SmJEL517_g04547 [Synchytrium microbalum]|uniref:E3 ubiquitin-protein ligase listerin n=1 Tax=Synchytrium microbalum TaxID=1806994 RepID=A0A507BRN5_9FUNG|nr:uncharacterized protein SmJEL517_g04547 [Synchytrium microbalum]TPX32340.1 hypothetical protein SmJEL517_g04547 [Synchytrium microbalum]
MPPKKSAASSGRAQEMLWSSASSSGTAFGAAVPTDDLDQLDAEIKVLFKKLQKREPVTKVKALEDLSVYISQQESDQAAKILSSWPKVYTKLSTDADRKVRETTNAVHLAIVKKVGKKLATILKEITGSWLCCLYDSSKEVVRVANEALQTAFPNPAKRTELLIYAQKDILQYISENVLEETAETMSDPRYTSPEDMASKYARVVSGCNLVLCMLVESLSAEEQLKAQELYSGILGNPKFWALSHHEASQIRKSVYIVVKTLVKCAPGMLESRISLISTSYLSYAFTDSDASTHSEMWESVLVFTKLFPSSWTEPTLKKPIVKRLYTFLDHASYGSVNISYPTLLPLLSVLSSDVLQGNFAKDFCSHFWNGLKSGVIDRMNSGIFFSSFLECIMYLLIRNSNDASLQHNLIDSPETKGKYSPPEMSRTLADSLYRLSASSQIPDSLSRLLISKVFSVATDEITTSDIPDFDTFTTRFSQLLLDLNSKVIASSNPNMQDTLTVSARDLCNVLLPSCAPNPGLVQRASLLAILTALPIWNETLASQIKTFLTRKEFGEMLDYSKDTAMSFFDVVVAYTSQEGSDASVWQHVVGLVVNKDKSRALVLFDELIRKTQTVKGLVASSSIEDFVRDLLAFDSMPANDCGVAERVLWSVVNTDSHWLTKSSKTTLISSIMEDVIEYTSKLIFDASPHISALSATHMIKVMTPKKDYSHLIHNALLGKFVSSILDLVAFASSLKDVRDAAVGSWNGLKGMVSSDASIDLYDELIGMWQKDVLDGDHIGSSDQFGIKASKLLDVTPMSLQSHVLDGLILNQTQWQHLSKPFQHPLPGLAITNSATVLETSSSSSSLSTSDDLVIYIRLGLITTGIINSQSTSTLFNDSRMWNMIELLYLSCLLDDLHTGTNQDTEDDGTTGEFAIETRRILEEVLRPCRDLDGDMTAWHTGLVGRLAKKESGVVSSGETRMIETAFVLSNEKEGRYSRVLGTILGKLFGMTQIRGGEAGIWFELIEECHRSGHTGTTIALLSSLRPHLDLSQKLKDFIHTIAIGISKAATDESLPSQLAVLISCIRLDAIQESTPDVLQKMSTNFMAVVRRLRKYHSSTGAKVEAIDVLMMDVLREFIDLKSSYDLNSAGFVVDLDAAFSQSSNGVLQYYALRLFESLLSGFRRDPGTWGVVDKQHVVLYRRCLALLIEQKDCVNPTKAQASLQNIIAKLCRELPEEILFESKPFDEMCPLLFVHNEEIQKCAGILLHRLTAEHVQATSLRVEMRPREQAEDVVSSPEPEEKLAKSLVDALGQVPSQLESGVVPENDLASNEAFGYIMAWMAYFDHLHDATFALKTAYVSQIKQAEATWSSFMEFLFATLGLGIQGKPFDLSKWDIQEFDIREFDFSSEVAFPLATAHLYWLALRTTPSLVRTWWSESKKRQLTLAVEMYTEKYFSPLLISREISTITRSDKSLFENLAIKASTKSSEVSATYTIEESGLEMIIRLPSSFPLKQVEVDSGPSGRAGVTDARWRAWLLSASAVMFAQNGSVLDAVMVFKKNISAHFEGM